MSYKLHFWVVLQLVSNMFPVTYATEEYQKIALSVHNAYRTNHHAPELQLDEQLNKVAVKCAEYYAKQRLIDHTCQQNSTYGENLASDETAWELNNFANVSTGWWYGGATNYDYKEATFNADSGHFTQLVWKSTTKLGFGIVKKDGFIVAVALYSPVGNVPGEFKKNVKKP